MGAAGKPTGAVESNAYASTLAGTRASQHLALNFPLPARVQYVKNPWMAMNSHSPKDQDLNRRDFLKGSSTATLLTMLGGVRLVAQSAESAEKKKKPFGPPLNVAVIGLGTWGRTILSTLGTIPEAKIAAVCDSYPTSLTRCATAAPGAAQATDYREVLKDPNIPAIIVATPTHQHKEIVLAALNAGKHVYCEAPIAHTVEDARAIALAAKAARHLVFQSGLQLRSDPQRIELIRTFRTGALGKPVMARAQWHKKQSWRAAARMPEREKELNWRLDKKVSLGLMGEIVSHLMDQATWFLDQQPIAIGGIGSVACWNDGRAVPDTVRLVLEWPNGFFMYCDATLANSFDGEYEMYYGTESAVMLRQSDVWLFKEVDARLLGWEVYFPKQQILNETGIILKVGASRSVPADQQTQPAAEAEPPETPLSSALSVFLGNARDFVQGREDYLKSFSDDPEGLVEHLATGIPRRPAPGYLEGFRAAVTAILANQAIQTGQRIVLKPESYIL